MGDDHSSFDVEDLYIGWRSGNSLGDLGENVLDFTVGRTQYKLGHGLLLWDGSAEGGSRGGYWTNARKAFEFAAIGRFKPGNHTVEAFYLDKDELPESNSDSKLWGVNYEYAFGEDTTLGATYMKWSANPAEAPQRDGLDVYNVRAFTAPFPNLKALSFELEYAKEDNGDLLDSEAWNALVAYQFDTAWKPKLSYRYAFFEGDNPATTKNEGFRRPVHRVLRLGHLVAGRDRRRILRLELEPDLAPAARAHEADRFHRHRAHLLRLPARQAGLGRSDVRQGRRTNSTGTWTGASTTTSSSASSPPSRIRRRRSNSRRVVPIRSTTA